MGGAFAALGVGILGWATEVWVQGADDTNLGDEGKGRVAALPWRPLVDHGGMGIRLAIVVMVLMLVGCGGPRSPQITRDQALRDNNPLEVRVVRIYDGLRHSRDPHVSHLVEVDILRSDLSPAVVGQRVVMPYDEWLMGKEPPRPGTVLMVAPATWVRGEGRRNRP